MSMNSCIFVVLNHKINMDIHFYKYQGTGNDFVMIDNRTLFFPKQNIALVAKLCDRKFGIGADGLILLENPDYHQEKNVDFKMIYYNSDGRESSMCGNGGRCAVAFAHALGIINKVTTFVAIDGLHEATIDQEHGVALQMKDVHDIKQLPQGLFLNTGSPHHIAMVTDLKAWNVKKEGAAIRYSDLYAPEGSNINFVEQTGTNTFWVRTYERGVEDETLSCGTGVTAVAIAMNFLGKTKANHVLLNTPGGLLQVSFKQSGTHFSHVFLKGPATFVFKGTISC